MNDQLVGYLIGALEIDDSRQVDQNLVECEETRRKLEIFRLALFPLEAIEHADPPAQLALRTCELIQRRRERNPG
jgi:anti-sigma-K factor RskA